MAMPKRPAAKKPAPPSTLKRSSTPAPASKPSTVPATTKPATSPVPASHQSSSANLPAVPQELMTAFQEDAAENLQNVHDAFHRVSIEGSRFKVGGQVIGNEGVSFEAIILRETPVNMFYLTKYNRDNPTNPDCWSLGGVTPDIACEHIQSESCITCKNNRYGTGTDQEGKRSRGKACRNSRRLVLNIEGVDLPVIMSIPPTVIKSFNQYLKMLTSNEPSIPMFAVRTLFTFDTSAEYPKPQMSFKSMLTPTEYLEVREYRLSAEVESALSAFASPSDIAPDGEESEAHAQERMEKGEGIPEGF